MWPTAASSALSASTRLPATAAMASASARARAASDDRRDSRLTRSETIAATMRKTTRATTLSVSAIVQLCTGGVKYQLTTSDATTAANNAGHSPPTTATAPTSM